MYAFPTGGSVLLDVHYSDGISTTKFGFLQVAGEGGLPEKRLTPTAECTEWRGTFTQVLVKARAIDNPDAVTFRAFGATLATGTGSRDTGGFVLDAIGNAGAFRGSLITCDDAVNGGSIHFAATVVPLHAPLAQPATVRLTEG